MANDLFLSSEDSEVETKPQEKNMKRKASKPKEVSTSKKSKTVINPITPPARITSQDLFGQDSDDEPKSEPSQGCSKTGKAIPPLYSYYTKRESKGYSRQISETKKGKYYVELKIYDAEEIKKIQPMNRWRHSIITIKTQVNDDHNSWRYVKDFVKATHADFKNCPVALLGLYDS